MQKKAVDQWVDYRRAYNFLSTNKDSSFYYFNRAASTATNKQQIALAYYNMALIQSDASDNYGAQESLTLSLKSLDYRSQEDRGYFASDYNELGMTYSNLNEYAQALTYYELALKYTDDKQLTPYILNNEGNTYQYDKAYPQSLTCYEKVLKLTGNKGASYARVLTNLATTKWLQNHRYNPVPELLHSLAIRVQENDSLGENSSYAHLADFYSDIRPDSALTYAKKMLSVAERLRSADDKLRALRKLIVLSSPKQAKTYFQHYQLLDDSVQTTRNVAKNQFAVIRYNIEKAKTENLELQKNNNEKRYQLIAVVIIAVSSSLFILWWYRKRRQILKIEAQHEIQQSKLQLSQKVHDRIANGIYRIISEVEHNTELQQTDLLDKLDDMYKVSRNIAHDEDGLADDFSERINVLLNAFKRTSIRLAVNGNEAQLWQSVSTDVKENLELVLQELMVNMSKHSKATQARIGFTSEQGNLIVDYLDNGIGISNKNKTGKGLENTVSRMEALHGSVKFGNEAQDGFRIHIEVPMR